MRILLVEDDFRVAEALGSTLGRRGYDVLRAGGVAEALGSSMPDLVLLDLNLPDGDGLQVCRVLRERNPHVGIIAISGRGEERDRVAALIRGADDYLVKPFSMIELLARMEAVLRRSSHIPVRPRQLTVGRLTIDFTERRVSGNGREASLTPKECDILAVLARSPGVSVTRQSMVLQVWRTSWGQSRSLEVHISSLRSKLAGMAEVQTVRGVGYRLRVERAA